MTHKTTMPEPALTRRAFHPSTGEVEQHLITTDQAEAYKDACVREALEKAERTCTNSLMMNTDSYCGSTARYCAERIRALIPKAGL